MRTGLWVSGAGGSGILIGRKEDGTWSPPSGIMLHTAGLGFLVGVDIYDCVVVINTQKALDAFSSIRCTVGGEISAVAGPVGVGGLLETELHARQAPVFTYLKSRGFYAGVQVDGTIMIERTDENERFYGERIGVKDIMAGKIRHPPYETRKLLETIKAAQGDSDVDETLIPDEPPPGDYEVENTHFGVPDQADPDPFGVQALQEAGFEIREAGTQKRPTSEQFEFKPSPMSPIYSTFRKSMDQASMSGSRRSSWRASTISSTLDSRSSTSTMVDTSTQTEFDAPPVVKGPPPALPPRQAHNTSPVMVEIPEDKSTDDVKPEVDEQKDSADNEPMPISLMRISKAFDDIDLDDEEFEEPVIHEIQQAATPQTINRPRIVTVAKPVAPKLPPRSPFRTRLSVNSDIPPTHDASTGPASAVSPPQTPSLKHDASSTSSHESISSMDALEHVSNQLQPKLSNVSEKKEENDQFHSTPGSPVKAIPGSFD
jgi:lipid-binding SYLF domain-containing protein